MWSEEELRDIPAEPVSPGSRIGRIASQTVRSSVSALNLVRAGSHAHELTGAALPSVVYRADGDAHGNFYLPAYRRILSTPNWHSRLQKAHTGKRGSNWRELDTAVSSDALLMNIFCAPRVLAGIALPALLGLDRGLTPEFGYRPATVLQRNRPDPTEIDMKLGSLLVEAKLTEADFQSGPTRRLERYTTFESAFFVEDLPVHRGCFLGYQLIRGVLAAEAEGARFAVFCDARRPDLIESWYGVMRAVRSAELRSRLRIHSWQEIAATLPKPLRLFLQEKYGIEASGAAGA